MDNEDFKFKAAKPAVCRWRDLVEAEDKYSDPREEWVFRGDSCDRPLRSTLERLFEGPKTTTHPIGIRKLERQLYSDFKRSFRIHAPGQEPHSDDDNILYWLSLMRHFGTPTRLLDFTYSLFIATFFALEKKGDADAVVWLISKTWLTRPHVLYDDSPILCVERAAALRMLEWAERAPAPEQPKPAVQNPRAPQHSLRPGSFR